MRVSNKKARDGRYARAKGIVWSRNLHNDKIQAVFNELILQDSDRAPDGEASHEADFLVVPKVQHLTIGTTCVPKNVELKSNPDGKFTKVTVLAGNFDNCIEVLVTVLPADESDFEKGWTTRSFYAPGVGLVKEVQQNNAGEVTYTLELTKFTIK